MFSQVLSAGMEGGLNEKQALFYGTLCARKSLGSDLLFQSGAISRHIRIEDRKGNDSTCTLDVTCYDDNPPTKHVRMRVPLHEKITTKRERKDALSRTIMEHVSYFSGVWRKLRRSLVFLTLESLVGDSLANHNSDLIVDRGEPLFGSFRDYNFMSKDAILFANQLIGYGNNFAGMIIHPFVLMTLRGLPEFRTKFFPDRRRYVHFYMGIPIVITEYMTVESKPIPESSLDKVYSSYLLGEGAFAYGEIVPEDSFGVSEYSSTMAVIASKVKFALQPWGYDCAVDPRKTVGWEDNPKSYSRVMDRGKIPLVVVKTRG